MKRVLSLTMALLLFCFCAVGVSAMQPRFQVLAATTSDIRVDDGEIIFWANAIAWEPAEISIYMEIEEVIDGDYEIIFTGSESDFSDLVELSHSIPYGPDRYFRMTVNFTAGPDKPETVSYFST